MTTDLAQRTPPDIDAEIAQLSQERGRAEAAAVGALDSLHHYANDRRELRSRGQGPWKLTEAEVLAHEPPRYQADAKARAIVRLAEGRREYAELSAKIAVLDAEHKRRGWSRFFLVLGGHIHSSMACSTCYPTTQFGWLPKLSGLVEADAVAAHGTILCSVCFPTAPVEWRVGPQAKVDPDRCPGSGKYAKTLNGNAWRPYGDCEGCGRRMALTPNHKIRAHKKPKGSKS